MELGKNGGAGNLIICEVLLIHISEQILNDENKIDQHKIKLVGRMGSNWYSKGFDEALFEVKKPTKTIGVGFDQIPNKIKNNPIFNQSELSKLASIDEIPSNKDVILFQKKLKIEQNNNPKNNHLNAKECIKHGYIKKAWKYLLIDKLNI